MVIVVSVKVRDLITHVPKNPTRTVLEETIAKLENGDRGFAFSSGMAAIQVLMTLLPPQMNGSFLAMCMVVLIDY